MPNGYDVRFTAGDGHTLLDYERECWSEYTSGGDTLVDATFWVKVPTISHTADTTIYIYYGELGAGDAQNLAAVWANGYAGVWHLDESGTAGDYQDSTGNGHDGSTTANDPTQAAGVIGDGQSFNGTSQYIATAASAALCPTYFTVEAWINTTSSGGVERAAVATDGNFQGYSLDVNVTSDKAGTRTTSPSYVPLDSTTSVNDGNWHHLVGTDDGTYLKIYVDGSLENTASVSGAVTPASVPLSIGRFDDYYGQYFAGYIDEVRVSNVARSPEWLSFEYDNISASGNELNWGSEEATSGLDFSHLLVDPPLTVQGKSANLWGCLSAAANEWVTFTDETDSENIITIGTVLADASGQANITYQVPPDATPGPHTLYARYGTASVSTTLTVSALEVAEFTITPTPAPALTPSFGTGQLTVGVNGSLVFNRKDETPLEATGVDSASGSAIRFNLSDTGGDRIDVTSETTGAVDLGGATLDVTSTRADGFGIVRVLIQQPGSNAVVGAFAGLTEGDTLPPIDGVTYRITYQYNAEAATFGDGNDVALVSSLFSESWVKGTYTRWIADPCLVQQVLDADVRFSHTDATADQYQLTEHLSQYDPDWAEGEPELSYQSLDESVATVNGNGLVQFVESGSCMIVVTATEEGYDDQTFAINLTGQIYGGETTKVYTPIPITSENVGDYVLVLYNADSQDSIDLKDYYLANRDGFAGANALPIYGVPDAHTAPGEYLQDIAEPSPRLDDRPGPPRAVGDSLCYRIVRAAVRGW